MNYTNNSLRYFTRVSQKFYNILVIWGTIWALQMLLLWLRRWQTTLDCKILSLPDTLWVLLSRFASVDWSTALKSMVLILPDIAWSSRFLQPKQNFWTIWLLYRDQLCQSFIQQMFLVASMEFWASSNS